MGHVTPRDVIEALGERIQQILNVASTAEVESSDKLRSAIERANARGDAACRKAGYTLPLNPPDASVKDAVLAIAKYRLIMDTRRELLQDADRMDYEDADKYLIRIADKKDLLQVSTPDAISITGTSQTAQLGAAVTDSGHASDQCWFERW